MIIAFAQYYNYMKLADKNLIALTKEIFSNYTSEKISDEIAREIQNGLISFFELILVWNEASKEK